MFFFSVLWLVWVVVGIATLVVFYRGMTALAKIPNRFDMVAYPARIFPGEEDFFPTKRTFGFQI